MAHSLFRLSSATFKFLFLPALLIAALSATGCHRSITNPEDPNFIVAEQGKWHITKSQLDQQVTGYLQQQQMTADQIGAAKMPMLKTAILDSMVLKELLQARAASLNLPDVDKDSAAMFDRLKAKFPTDKEFNDQLKTAGLTADDLKKRIREDVQIRKLLDAEAFHDVNPTADEVNTFYMMHQADFNIPAKVSASRVLVLVDEKATPAEKAAKKKIIDDAHARVAKGEDFAKVAQDVSKDRYSAPRGGDLGSFQRGENEAQFDDVAFNSKVGVLSSVFETPMGYQFLKVTDSQPAHTISTDEAKPRIVEYLKQSKQQQQQQEYAKKLLADSHVTYHIKRQEITPADMNPPGNAAPESASAGDASAPEPSQAPAPTTDAAPSAPAPAK